MPSTLPTWLTLALSGTLVVLGVSITLTSAVQAQSSADDEEARRLFQVGREAFDRGELAEAIEYFEQAYQLSQRHELLFNIAVCHDRLHQSYQALDAYRRYTQLVPDGDDVEYAQGRIRVLEALVANDTETPPNPDGNGVPNEGNGSEPSQSARGGDPFSPLGIGLVAAGVVLATGGAIAAALWWTERSDVADQCRRDGCTNTADIEAERDAAAGVSFSLIGVGAALIVAGTIIWIMDATSGGAEDEEEPDSDSDQNQLVSCAPYLSLGPAGQGAGGFGCGGQF